MSDDMIARLQEALADRDARLVVITAERDRLSAENFMQRVRIEALQRTIEGHGSLMIAFDKLSHENEELIERLAATVQTAMEAGQDEQDKDWGC